MAKSKSGGVDVNAYAAVAISHLKELMDRNREVMNRLVQRLVQDVPQGNSLLVFGSGHSSIFAFELYHRAGGASFVVPLVADYLLPTVGPPVVRLLERTVGVATPILNRAEPKKGEMLWLASQSGINAAVVDLAIEAKKRGLVTVAFTSVAHSSAVSSRHPSGKRLFEVCDECVDLGGEVGDACVEVAPGVRAGPFSSMGSILAGHSILVAAMTQLEAAGHRCVYTSVNTPDGELRNRELEKVASVRDPLLR